MTIWYNYTLCVGLYKNYVRRKPVLSKLIIIVVHIIGFDQKEVSAGACTGTRANLTYCSPANSNISITKKVVQKLKPDRSSFMLRLDYIYFLFASEYCCEWYILFCFLKLMRYLCDIATISRLLRFIASLLSACDLSRRLRFIATFAIFETSA